MNPNQIAKPIALLSTGLLAGTFFYATVNVLPTFWEVPTPIHLAFRTALMRHNALTMQLSMGIAIGMSIWFSWTVRHSRLSRSFALLAVCLGLSTLLITRLGNVPINLVIKTWNLSTPPANWLDIMARWDRFHTYRTISAIGGFVCLILADTLSHNKLSSIPSDIR
ncbi:anthrone oxygenase family protein [Spirosoma gilvum]